MNYLLRFPSFFCILITLSNFVCCIKIYRTMKKLLLVLVAALLQVHGYGQSVEFFKKILEELASERIGGRSYNGGDSLAADFIAQRVKDAGAEVSFQKVTFPIIEVVRTVVRVEGVVLKPGLDYIANPTSVSK